MKHRASVIVVASAWFRSKRECYSYYSAQHVPRQETDNRLKEKQIHIGTPTLPEEATALGVDDDGRYFFIYPKDTN